MENNETFWNTSKILCTGENIKIRFRKEISTQFEVTPY